MTRSQVGRILTALAALGFVATAAIHSTGYGSIVQAAGDVPGMMGRLMPALWLAFSLDLTVIGLILGAIAWRPSRVNPLILLIAALCPLAAAGLQLATIGFVPPTAILIALGVITLAAAATSVGRS